MNLGLPKSKGVYPVIFRDFWPTVAEAFFAERNKIRIANRKKPTWESVDPRIRALKKANLA